MSEAHDHPADPALIRLAALQRDRATRERAAPLAPAFAAAAVWLERSRRRLGRVAQAWEGVCPAEHVERTAIVGLAGGTLTVRVADDATRFEIDRALRAGAERELIRRCPAGVARVRLVSGPLAGPPAAAAP